MKFLTVGSDRPSLRPISSLLFPCIISFSTSSCCWVRPRRLLTISYSTLWPSLRELRSAPFHDEDRDEYAFDRSLGLNESVPLPRVEPFDRASRHHRLLACNQRDHDRTTGAAIGTLPHRAALCGTACRDFRS